MSIMPTSLVDDLEFMLEIEELQLKKERDGNVIHVGTLIAEFRVRAGFETVEALAEASGVCAKTIFKLETGLLPFDQMTFELLQALGNAIRLSVKAMVTAGHFQIRDLKHDTHSALWRRPRRDN